MKMRFQRAGTYLSGFKPEITNDTNGAELDEITFIQFVLAQANTFDETTIGNLYNIARPHEPIQPGIACLHSQQTVNPADERVHDLISNLESSAIRHCLRRTLGNTA